MKKTKILGLLFALTIYSCNNLSVPVNNTSNINISKSEFKVGNTRNSFQGEVSTLLMDDGSSVITWSAVEGSLINIYAQKLNKDLKPEGDEFKVNTIDIIKDPSLFSVLPKIVSDNNGFIISWTNNKKLYLRKYDKNSKADKAEINPKFNINGQESEIYGAQKDTNIILPDKKGSYFILGSSSFYEPDYSSGYGQLFDENFKPIGTIIKIPANTIKTFGGRDKQDNILLIFCLQNTSKDSFTLYGQKYKIDLSPIGENFKIENLIQRDSRTIGVSVSKDGSLILAGDVEYNNGANWDIYLQKYNSENNLLAGSTVNTEKLRNSLLHTTKVAVNNNSEFVVTWGNQESNYFLGNIYARRYDKNGNPKEKEFKVDYLSRGIKSSPDVSLNNNGDFLISWSVWNDNKKTYDIYARKYNINQQLPFDDLDIILNSKDCKPNQEQLNQIKNQKSYTGELKVKVTINYKTFELKSKEDYQNIVKNAEYDSSVLDIKTNGYSYMNNHLTNLKIKTNNNECFQVIMNKYGLEHGSNSYGYYSIHGDYNKALIDKFEELLRKYIIQEKLDIKEIEFGNYQSFAAFTLYMELKLNYSYMFEQLYFNQMLTLH